MTTLNHRFSIAQSTSPMGAYLPSHTSVPVFAKKTLRIVYLKIITAIFAVIFFHPVAAGEQVPFGDKVSANIVNYHRHTPQIATSGKLLAGAVEEIQKHGFKTVLDMRTPKEGTEEEGELVKAAGIQYLNIPVTKAWPEPDVFARFKSVIENQKNHPILIHCASANRVGMMWSAYRIEAGIDRKLAILEGQTIGMKSSREKQLIENVGAK